MTEPPPESSSSEPDAPEAPAPVPLPPTPLDSGSLGDATPLAYRVVRGGLWVLGGSYWTIAFGFVANILLTRLLTPQIYGEFALAMFFFTLLQIRPKFALNFAFAQHKTTDGTSIGTFFWLEVAFGFAGLVLALIAAPILYYGFHYPVAVVAIFVVLSTLAFIESFFTTFGVVLEKNLYFMPVSVIGSVAMPLSYIPAFWLALRGNGELSLVAQTVTLTLVSIIAIAGFALARMRYVFGWRWRYSAPLAGAYIRFGALTGTGNFVAGLVTQADNFLVGTFAGTAALGYYDRAYRTAQWPGLLLNALLTRSALYTYTNLKDDDQRLQKTVDMLFWVCAAVATPVAIALFITAPDFVLVLYGEQWLPAVPILRILLLVAIIRPFWENVTVLFVGIGLPQRVIWISLLQLAIIFALGGAVVGRFGGAGVAVAVGVSMVVVLILAHNLVRKRMEIHTLRYVGFAMLAGALSLAGYYLAERFIDFTVLPPLVRLAVKAAYAVVSVYAFMFLLQPRGTLDRLRYVMRLASRREKVS